MSLPNSPIPLPSRLVVQRVAVTLNPWQRARVDVLFADQICVLRLLANEGLKNCSRLTASQFLLRHRAELDPHLGQSRSEQVDRLTALVQSLSTDIPGMLRRDMPGLPCVAGTMLSLPLKGWGPLPLCLPHETAAVAKQCNLIQGFGLLHYGDRLEVELQWWQRSPGLRNVMSPPVLSGRPPRGRATAAANKALPARQPAKTVKQSTPPAPRKTAAVQAITMLNKKQRARLRSLGMSPYPQITAITRRGTTLGIPPSSAAGVHLPPQNFPRASEAAMTTVSCSCNGDNPTCFRCDGRGYYERPALIVPGQSAKPDLRQRRAIVRNENDPRGGAYSVRENGRFLSNAVHDNFDDESAP